MPILNLNQKPTYKILVVDNDPITRAFVQAALRVDGFQVFLAKDGKEGLEKFLAHAPDLILTDYAMPGMNGAEFTLKIHAILKASHGDTQVFLPVVVFTAQGEPEVLKDCLDAGAIEFLTKPFNVTELRTRIHAIAELAAVHSGLMAREAEEQDEISMVKHMLDRLLEQGRDTMPAGFRMETMATRRINGDVCTYHTGAPGIHFGMLCDPMGHGLMAGISEIPTIEVFKTLSGRDLPLPSILAEINQKLMNLLPWGRFSCVLLFRLDAHTGELQIANAGMPESFIFHVGGGLTRYASTSIPLGIQEDLGSLAVNRHCLLPGDCFFACSDGLSEIVDEKELVELYEQGGDLGFPELLQELIGTRVGNRELADDLSWSLWPYHPEQLEVRLPASPSLRHLADEEYLSLRLQFHPNAVNYYEVGPNLVGFLGRQGVPKDVSQTLALLLSEAIVNAVDHGSLGLDSALKEVGFEAYEVERSHRLASGGKGPVDLQIRIHQRADGAFSHLSVHVVDPGLGFDWRPHLSESEAPATRPYGRGILLLKALAQDLAFSEKGNEIQFSLYARED